MSICNENDYDFLVLSENNLITSKFKTTKNKIQKKIAPQKYY